MTSLLHPQYFGRIPLLGKAIKSKMELLGDSTTPSSREHEGISVAIRTLNEEDKLKSLLTDIKRQEFEGEIEIIVIDNESTDNTVEVAESFGASVLTLPRPQFTYPRSMNMAVEASTHELVFLTVGHAELVSTVSLRAGIKAIYDEGPRVGGAFGHALPGVNASTTESLIAMGSINFTRRRSVKKASTGTMAATGCIVRKSVWSDLGKFDESYERGGEDTYLASKMLESGYAVIDEPLLSTHHTHGLSFIHSVRQWIEWSKLKRPSKINKKKLQKRRPDLDLEV